jgi:hypothetical protein
MHPFDQIVEVAFASEIVNVAAHPILSFLLLGGSGFEHFLATITILLTCKSAD